MANKNTILYVMYDGLTDPLGQSQVLAYLKRFNSEKFRIHIISFEKKENFNSNFHSIALDIKTSSIKWTRLTYTKSPPILSTLYDIARAWQVAKKIYLQEGVDIVHSRGYIAAIIGLRMKNKFNTKFIFDMRGWWVDEKKESGNWDSFIYKPIYTYYKNLEKKFFQESDFVVSLTNKGKTEIIRLGYNKPDSTIGVIPTCVDFDLFKPFNQQTKATIREALRIPPDVKVMVYSGSVGGNYSANDLLSIFEAYKKRNPGSYLLILSKEITETEQKIFSKEKDVILTSAPFTKVYQYLSASDIGVIFYKMNYSVIGRSPTKLGEYWACGVPVISFKGIGDLDLIAEKYPNGLTLLDPKTKEIHFENVTNETTFKEILRANAVDYFDINKGVEFYQAVYNQLSPKMKI